MGDLNLMISNFNNMKISPYEEGLKVKDIAKIHERSNGAIMARLMKIGGIESR